MYGVLAFASLLICIASTTIAVRLIDRNEVRKSIGVACCRPYPFLFTYYLAIYPDSFQEAVRAYAVTCLAFWVLAYFQFCGSSLSKKDLTELWQLLAKKKEGGPNPPDH